jgi:hypothetical protein
MFTGRRKSAVTFVPSSDARSDDRADTYGRSEREERVMGVMDFEVQRERRMEMLRKAESRRVAESWRAWRGARALSRLAGFLAIIR